MTNLYMFLIADAVEKRWSSLRDMFNREHRKQKLSPSGSGYNSIKEWELYRVMLFLTPHIAHRRLVLCCNIYLFYSFLIFIFIA